jgi:hypothetical protein
VTARLPFTQLGLKRAMLAAKAAGLHVAGIKPDGTLLVHDGDNPPPGLFPAPPDDNDSEASRWRDTGV